MAKNYVQPGDTITIAAPGSRCRDAGRTDLLAAATKLATITAPGNTNLGTAVEAAAASTGAVKVRLSGF